MKVYTVLTVSLSVFFSVLTCVIYNSVIETQQASSTSDEAGTLDLVRRLDSIQARLDSLAVTVEELPRLETLSAATVVPDGDDSPVGGGNGEISAGEPSADPATSTGERLAALLELKGGEEDVRQYVAGIIEDDRKSQKTLQRQRRDERRAMSKGPYGKYNFQVNSLAGKLGLDDGQKNYCHELLKQYSKGVERLRILESTGKPFWTLTDPQQIQAHVKNMEEQRGGLGEQLEREFVQSLDQGQADAYLELPDSERWVDEGLGVSHQSTGSFQIRLGSTEDGGSPGGLRLSFPSGGLILPAEE